MKIKRVVIALVCVLISVCAFAKRSKTKQDYLKQLAKFYEYLSPNKGVTVENVKDLFGWDGVGEFEESIFFKECKKNGTSDKECSENFGNYYRSSSSISLYFLKIREQTIDLTQGYPTDSIKKFIRDLSVMIDDGEEGVMLIKLVFPNKKNIFFALERYPDEPPYIGEIFLPNGASIDNKIYLPHNHYMEINGTIKDADGFVNVRKNSDTQSPIVCTLKKGDKFIYMPNDESRWWKIKKENTSPVIGYVYYDRVQPDSNWKEIH